MSKLPKKFDSFTEFWPFYLSQHRSSQCRFFHFLGTSVALILLAITLFTGSLGFLGAAFILGYGCAWFGHFSFEKNRPATFQYPLYSFWGDWKMFWMMLQGTLNQEWDKLGLSRQDP